MAVAIRNYPQLECEIVTDFVRLENIAADWHRLWMASPKSEVFQNFGWARAFWKAFGDQLSLFTPVVYRGSEVVGILPLALREGILQFLGSPLSDYNDIICADECVAEVLAVAVNGLLRAREQWGTCVMDNVSAQSRFARHLPDLQPATRRHFRTAFRCPCPTIVFGPSGDVVATLVRKQSMRRGENRLRKLGELKFRHLEDREDIARHLNDFFHQHISRRAIAGQTSHFLEPHIRRMFGALVEDLDPCALLRFAVLTLDDRPVAYHLGFQANGKLIFYQSAFDVDYRKYSPGDVLLRRLLLYAQECKLSEFDLTRGGEIYKDRFATHIRENLTVLFNHDLGLRRRIQVRIQQADGGSRKMLERLRKYPPAYRLARITALHCLNFWRREVRVRRREGAGYVAGIVRRFVRNFIFDHETRVAFAVGKRDVRQYADSPDAGLSVRPTALSEIALISANHPEITIPLRQFQGRLAGGQQIYVTRQGSKPVQIWCMSAQSNPARNQDSRLHAPMLILEQCWTAPWFCGSGLFKGILQQVCDRDMDVLVSCQERDQIAQEMRRAGLHPSRRAIRFRLLRWFRPFLSFTRGCENPSKSEIAAAELH